MIQIETMVIPPVNIYSPGGNAAVLLIEGMVEEKYFG